MCQSVQIVTQDDATGFNVYGSAELMRRVKLLKMPNLGGGLL